MPFAMKQRAFTVENYLKYQSFKTSNANFVKKYPQAAAPAKSVVLKLIEKHKKRVQSLTPKVTVKRLFARRQRVGFCFIK